MKQHLWKSIFIAVALLAILIGCGVDAESKGSPENTVGTADSNSSDSRAEKSKSHEKRDKEHGSKKYCPAKS